MILLRSLLYFLKFGGAKTAILSSESNTIWDSPPVSVIPSR